MDNFAIVRQEHMTHHGSLFGGSILKWVDEYAWLTASLDYPRCRLVTVAMDRVIFPRSTVCGAILRFHIRRQRQGTTSVTYSVDVHADEPGSGTESHIFSTRVTLVRVDEQGNKSPLPPVADRVRSDE